MTTQAKAAQGTMLKMGDGAPITEGFAVVAEVTNISGPGMSVDAIDVTSHSSGGAREFIGGLLDGGEVSFDLNFVPGNTSHDGVTDAMIAKTVKNWQLVFPVTPAVTWSFAALVTGFEPGASVDGAITASATLKVTGVPTLGV